MDPAGLQGVCTPPRGPATCTGRTRCPIERPVCLATKAGATCEAPDSKKLEAADVDERLTCTLQSDCNGEEMCMHGWGETQTLGTFCGRWTPGLSGTLVCDPRGQKARKATAAEVARVCGESAVCRA